jgi:hypothetical protein
MAMAIILQGISAILGIIGLVCFVMVVVKMFQNDQTGLGIACIVLVFCGIGALIALVYGWIKADEWKIKNLMIGWTVCIVLNLIVSGIFVMVTLQAVQQEIQNGNPNF